MPKRRQESLVVDEGLVGIRARLVELDSQSKTTIILLNQLSNVLTDKRKSDATRWRLLRLTVKLQMENASLRKEVSELKTFLNIK